MNIANSDGRERPNGHAGTAKQRLGRPSIHKALRDAIEAALRADPAALANSKPRTGLELIVRGAVLNARKGKITALKLLMEWSESDGSEAAPGLPYLSSNSLQQGISEGIL